MLSFAAGWFAPPLPLTALNAASVENGLVRRPHPATTHEAALLLINQIMPATVIETVAVRFNAAVVTLALSVSVYVKVSTPSNPAGGLYVNLPMSAPDVVMTICPPFAVVASKALIVDVGLVPKKSFAVTLNGVVRFAELILTLPTTVTGKVSLVATGDAASEPASKLVFVSTVSVNVTPVAVSPLAAIPTVYFSVSPGSALLSLSASIIRESVLVAVTVGAKKGASIGFVATACFGFTALECELEFLATSGTLGGVLGCAFLNDPARLDSTDTEKTTAAKTATVAIRTGTERFDLIDLVLFEVLRMLRLRITRARV